MGPSNGVNLSKVSYFPLEEYFSKIKLNDTILVHLDETNRDFDKYINQLKKFPPLTILYFLINSFSNEIIDTNLIENHIIDPIEINNYNIFIKSLSMNNKRIKELHQFVTRDTNLNDYRTSEVRVSGINNGKEEIFWYGVNPEEINKFMNDFLKIYHNHSLSFINQNPFIKGALLHLLFVRIHPFSDGNGRTARIIHTIKFTQMVNDIYKCHLKISPLHLSQSILLNKITYQKRINNIYFDLEHDSNKEINDFIDFILDMTDEQLFYMGNQLENASSIMKNIKDTVSINEIERIAKSMRLSRRR